MLDRLNFRPADRAVRPFDKGDDVRQGEIRGDGHAPSHVGDDQFRAGAKDISQIVGPVHQEIPAIGNCRDGRAVAHVFHGLPAVAALQGTVLSGNEIDLVRTTLVGANVNTAFRGSQDAVQVGHRGTQQRPLVHGPRTTHQMIIRYLVRVAHGFRMISLDDNFRGRVAHHIRLAPQADHPPGQGVCRIIRIRVEKVRLIQVTVIERV